MIGIMKRGFSCEGRCVGWLPEAVLFCVFQKVLLVIHAP
jgi:hypothetical protein